jgi:hypothetical protein
MYPKLQVWYGLELALVAIGFAALCGFFLFVPPTSTLFGPPQSELLINSLMEVILTSWPLILVACAVIVGIGVLLSHRLAGPLYGLSRTLEEWRQGNLQARVWFRKYDYLLPLKEPLNQHFEQQMNLVVKGRELAKRLQSANAEQTKAIAKELSELFGKGQN